MNAPIARIALLAALMAVSVPLRAEQTPAQVCDFSGANFLSSGENQNGRPVDEVARVLAIGGHTARA